jgi:integrase
MGATLKLQRDGTIRPNWYGDAWVDGKRVVINLSIPVRGTPPESGSLRQTGDSVFEASRKEAENKLALYLDEARRKGRSEHLAERLIESKTGRTVRYVQIADLPERWRNLGREATASERYLVACDAHFRRFIEFMRTRHQSAVHLYEVTPEDATAFVASCRSILAPATAKYAVRLMNKAFSRFLPVGAANPFAEFVGRRTNGETGVVHRKPFTPEELNALLEAARNDDYMYPLIVTAACTGMRRGDVCRLAWNAVDLSGGMLAVKTAKTESSVEIPIFAPLRDVLEKRGGKGRGHVFPEAVAMLRDNPNGLTWRFKKLAARAFAGNERAALPEIVPASTILAEGSAAIREHVQEGSRRDRMIDILRRYAAGESVRQIEKANGCSRATVSADLHAVQSWIGKKFMKGIQGPDTKLAIARLTRIERSKGQRAASVRDWHALRATWVTMALSAGVPVELVRRVTGHATVEVILKHYFRPGRAEFKAALTGALPAVLTGDKPKRLKPADELAALAGKVAAGSATEEDKARFRQLAAAV